MLSKPESATQMRELVYSLTRPHGVSMSCARHDLAVHYHGPDKDPLHGSPHWESKGWLPKAILEAQSWKVSPLWIGIAPELT